MSSLKIALLSALLSALVLVAPDAQAQFAVFDVASVTQLIQQAQHPDPAARGGAPAVRAGSDAVSSRPPVVGECSCC